MVTTDLPSAVDFCKAVASKTSDNSFHECHNTKGAPLAMIAFAEVVVESIIRRGLFENYFDGLSMTVPPCNVADSALQNPYYHSIVGQQLLLVDWERTHGIKVPQSYQHQLWCSSQCFLLFRRSTFRRIFCTTNTHHQLPLSPPTTTRLRRAAQSTNSGWQREQEGLLMMSIAP